MSFYFDEAGDLSCDKVRLESLVNGIEPKIREISIAGNLVSVEVPATPLYVYSAAGLRQNVRNYIEAMAKANLQGILGYAAKANGNLEILRLLRNEGVGVLVCVSGHEVLAGLKAGFPSSDIILNGNGKQEWEIKLGISLGVVINVDSDFDAERIVQISMTYFPTTKKVRVLLRLKPADPLDCTVPVHPYVNTSGHSKFGFSPVDLDKIVGILNRNPQIKIHGLQCHLGSCIYDPQIYAFISRLLLDAAQRLLEKWTIEIDLLDLGGGFAIDYAKDIQGFPTNIVLENDGEFEKVPNIQDFVQKLAEFIPKDKKWTILLEPGRSLVATGGLLLSKCLGVKGVANGSNYLVLDASMTDLIRPCLYGAIHKIYPTKIPGVDRDRSKWVNYDVVGPVCETSDFLRKNVQLPQKSDFVAIMDTGAYGSTMSSNYNMRPRIAEVLIDGDQVKLIRERDTFEDLLRQQVTFKK